MLRGVGAVALGLGLVFGLWKLGTEVVYVHRATQYLLEPVGRTPQGVVVTRRELLDALIIQAQREGTTK